MPEIPIMSLKTVQFNPTVFTPTQYEYKATDTSLLAQSLAQREARMKEAAQSKSAIDRTLGELELKLNPAEAEWFAGYKNEIRNQIQSSIDAGDYGAAIRNATTLAGSVIQDPRILGRIRSQEAYDTELKTQQARRDKGEISQNTYDWWVANNKYSYTDNTDGNGNYVESSPWQAESRPVADINWAGQAMAAFKMITPDKGTKGRESKTSTTNADGTGTASGSSSTQSYEKVRAEDIRANIERMLSATPDGYRQAEQAFDVSMFEFKRMEQEYAEMPDDNPDKANLLQKLEQRRQLMYNNGSPISYKEYYTRMVTDDLYSHGLAYDWRTDDRSSSSATDNKLSRTATSTTLGGSYGNTPYNYGTWMGPNVQFGLDYNFTPLYNAQNGINSLYNTK